MSTYWALPRLLSYLIHALAASYERALVLRMSLSGPDDDTELMISTGVGRVGSLYGSGMCRVFGYPIPREFQLPNAVRSNPSAKRARDSPQRGSASEAVNAALQEWPN